MRKEDMSTKFLVTWLENPNFFGKVPKKAFLVRKTKGMKIPAGAVYVKDNVYVVEANGKTDWEKLGGVKIFTKTGYAKKLPRIE